MAKVVGIGIPDNRVLGSNSNVGLISKDCVMWKIFEIGIHMSHKSTQRQWGAERGYTSCCVTIWQQLKEIHALMTGREKLKVG